MSKLTHQAAVPAPQRRGGALTHGRVPDHLQRLFASNRVSIEVARGMAAAARAENRAVRARALRTRQCSRPRSHFARVSGTLTGTAHVALVRQDGSAVGDPRWLCMAALPSEETVGAAWPSPLRTTLSLSRSCDRLLSVQFVDVGRPNAPLAAGCTAMCERWGVPFSMDVCDHGDVHLVRLAGEIDMAVASDLGARLTEIAGSTIVIDLSAVSFLDACGLSELLGARRRITEAGHAFHLRGAQGITRRVFELCGLEDVLD